MSKRTLMIGLVCLTLSAAAQGQDLQLKYLDSNNQPVEFTTAQVTSDYGKRNLSSGSFHNGVDFGASLGTPLLSLTDGTVSFITAFKQIAIRGNNGMHFSYMHIFNDNQLDANGTLRIGDFVFVRLLEPVRYVILNLNTGTAIGTDNQDTINYNGVKYPVKPEVKKDQAIAPAGVSGCPGCGSHLHLYRLVNPAGGTTISSFNTVNPLQVVNHAEPPYNIRFSDTYRITTPNSSEYYAGNTSSAIGVKVQMQNAVTNTSYNTFTNVTMDVDKVTLLMKKDYEDTTRYDTIRGVYYISKVDYGGRLEANHYHAPIYPSRMATDTKPYGNEYTSGVEPHAYSSGDYDVFWFSDIYTRLHKAYINGEPEKYAAINDEAMYPDGNYHLAADVITVNNKKYNNYTNPQSIIIDNFRPYIEKLEITANRESAPFYSRSWIWDGASLKLNAAACPVATNPGSITVKVYASEPMQYVQVSAFGTTQKKTEPDDTSRTRWSFQFETASLSPGRQYFVITGNDIAGNPVEGFRSENPVTAVPVRQDNNTWNPIPTQQSDSVHYYQVASGPVSAAFISQVAAISDGLSLQFTNKSEGAFTSSRWLFGDGSSSAETNPLHLFTTSGSFDVKLTVTDCSTNSVSEKKSHLTLLPYITRLEIKSTNKDSVISVFERKLVNRTFSFSGRQKAIDEQTDIKVSVYPSGPLKNIALIIKNDEGIVTFLGTKQETNADSIKVFDFLVPQNKLSAGTNYIQIQGLDFADNQLLKHEEPSAYPYLLKEGTSSWSTDTLGFTGTDNNYSLYVRQGKLDMNEVLIFPNPANKRFNIECGSIIESVSIYSLKGALINKIDMHTYYREMNVSGYPAGIYFVKVKTSTAEIVRKISIFR